VADRSRGDMEAWRIGATLTQVREVVMWRHGRSERRRRRGVMGQKRWGFGGELGLDASRMGKRLYTLITGRV
jgi:hypothetical protein